VLDAASFDVDALAFGRLAAQSGRSELEAAAKLYTGELLDGLDIESKEFESWRREEAARYKDQAIDVLHRLMAQRYEHGEIAQAIEAGKRILRLEPLHEATVRRLMWLYTESGRRGAAVELYRTLADSLRTELDAQPEAETRLALAEIAQAETRISRPAAAIAEPPRSTSMARTSDSIEGPIPLPARPALRLRTPLMILAAALIAALGLVSYRQFALLGAQPGIVAERAAAADPASAISIAVLPFLNLSGDANQEFFSDGMTEEITAALAKVHDLKVVARTSAFRFKGEKSDMRVVGQALNATHLVEGSVRKVGDRVRITAQLIEVGKGTHLWTESYDRQLSDIFATQEEIARTIVGSLMAPLGLAPGERLVSNRSIDPDSYQQFLRAKAVLLQGNAASAKAIEILEPLVVRNPDYAPGWIRLSEAYRRAGNALNNASADERRAARETLIAKAETAARRAVQLDPNSAESYLILSLIQTGPRRLALIEDLGAKALALDPTNPLVLHFHSNMLLGLGRIKEALVMKQQLHELEPFIPLYSGNLAEALWLDGQNDAAIAILKDNLGRPGAAEGSDLPRIYASLGRYEEAADILSQFPPPSVVNLVAEAVSLLRSAPAKVAQPASLPRLGSLGFIYLHIGAPERALEFYEEGVFIPPEFSVLWHSSYAPVRKIERFKALMRKVGLVDYWRAKGWPEFCRPTTGDDFECG